MNNVLRLDARLAAWGQLMRLDRPIGTLLLWWPTLWALWLSSDGRPQPLLVLVFSLGVFVMRSAGCVINDYADRDFDGHVARTRGRPLATGAVSPQEALLLFAGLIVLAFALVLALNLYTILLSVPALLLAASYPFMKRFTHFPQLVLGAAFSWAIPMVYAAQLSAVPGEAWWLFCANLLWIVAYDSWYALMDREDDLKVGIRSTAVLFGRWTAPVIALLQLLALLALLRVGQLTELGLSYHLSLLVAAVLFIRQQWLGRQGRCFEAFLNNNQVGMALFAGIALDYALGYF